MTWRRDPPPRSVEELRAQRIEHYRTHRNSLGERMVRALLRANATVECAISSNEIAERMGLFDLSVDVDEIVRAAETILRAEIVALMACHADLPFSSKVALANRSVARMLPTRDNPLSTERLQQNAATIARNEDLAGAMRREMKNVKK